MYQVEVLAYRVGVWRVWSTGWPLEEAQALVGELNREAGLALYRVVETKGE